MRFDLEYQNILTHKVIESDISRSHTYACSFLKLCQSQINLMHSNFPNQ
jgi:hypothetical protein